VWAFNFEVVGWPQLFFEIIFTALENLWPYTIVHVGPQFGLALPEVKHGHTILKHCLKLITITVIVTKLHLKPYFR
jgi:hypothetical protein